MLQLKKCILLFHVSLHVKLISYPLTHISYQLMSTHIPYQLMYPINSHIPSTHVPYQLMYPTNSCILSTYVVYQFVYLLIHISYQLMYSVNLCTCILPTHTSYQLRYSINSCILQDQISFKTHESYQDICLSKCCFYPY